MHVRNVCVAHHMCGVGRPADNYETPEGEIDNSESRMGMGQIGASWTGDNAYAGASYGYDDTKYGIPVVEEGSISLTPRRHAFSVRAGASEMGGWLQSYRATLGVRRYKHSELEGEEVGTTFNNKSTEAEV